MNRILELLLISIITLVLLESGSFLLFQYLTGLPFSYTAISEKRKATITSIQARYLKEKKETLYVLHPYLGYSGRPGAKPWGEHMPGFNSFGMMSVSGAPYPSSQKKDAFVVGIVGGSLAEIFANHVETEINAYVTSHYKINKPIILINLATGGYKQPQQLFHIQYALLCGFTFDAIINIDGFNEIALASYNYNHSFHPVFPSIHHLGLMATLFSSSTPDIQTIKTLLRIHDVYARTFHILSILEKPPLGYSVFLNLFSELWLKRAEIKANQLEYGLIEHAQININSLFSPPPLPQGDIYSVAADMWAHSSRMLYAICQANHIRYVHILQPNQYVQGTKPLTFNEQTHAINPENTWGISAKEGYSHLIERGHQLQAEGIPFYDFTMVFKDIQSDIYVDDCCHINALGNSIIAKKLSDILIQYFQ
ncbi:MAG: hypothetical protein HQK77_17865 [Desulfobacterales bacterium]|nr:hypothetical protein [Desulfobacterales bacterium]